MPIRFFSKSETHSEFSNFAPYPVEIDGTLWPSTEHYYQAQKFTDVAMQEKIRAAKKPVIAKKLAQKHRNKIRADWTAMRDAVMDRAVRAKFGQHEALGALLLATGDEDLAEASLNDYYWGIGQDGSGQNRLGKLLMQIRAEGRAAMAPSPRQALMGNSKTIAANGDAPLFAWLGPLAKLTELGTAGYSRPVRRRLTIVNAMAFLIAIFSGIYACVFASYGLGEYWPLVLTNLALLAVALVAPFLHRINDIAAAMLIAIAEFIALFFIVKLLGRNSGVQINYIVAAAVAFAIYGLSHVRLVAAVIAAGLALHIAAWFLFPAHSASIAAPPGLLANLYVSSAVTTFSIIALVVGYAFTLADHARAEADALLANILPAEIVERLKLRPGESVADSVADASVLFSDLVGFTALAQRLGAPRTVALLDDIVTEFDRLMGAHEVEKIKTIGDGYMAVAGVSHPQDDHLPRLARVSLRLREAVEQLAAKHGVDLKVRIGIAAGPVMAGVIGADKFSYDVWGETVNLAARLESHSLPGEIQVSDQARQALGDAFLFEPRGVIEMKGIGQSRTWLLKAEREAASEGRAAS